MKRMNVILYHQNYFKKKNPILMIEIPFCEENEKKSMDFFKEISHRKWKKITVLKFKGISKKRAYVE